jgi:hypothetical protein
LRSDTLKYSQKLECLQDEAKMRDYAQSILG